MKIKNLFYGAIALTLVFTSCSQEDTTRTILIDFEEIALGAQGYLNGSDGSGNFTSKGIEFIHSYTDWGGGMTSWDGFAASNRTDIETPGYANEFSAITGKGANNTAKYAVGFMPFVGDLTFNCPKNEYGYFKIKSMMLTNSTYAYLAMRDGNDGGAGYAEKFSTNDWYKITIKGYKGGVETGTVDYYLADFRNGQTFVSNTWNKVDVSRLGEVDKVVFLFDSTSKDEYDMMKNPAYICIDNIEFTQEVI